MLKIKKKNITYNFQGKTVLITGASRGIGYEVAKKYLKYGANLMICSKDPKNIKKSYMKLKKIKKSNQKLYYQITDISSPQDINLLINQTIRKLKKIDILINNAGIYGPKGIIEKIDWNDWVKTIEVNLFGAVLLCRLIVPHFKKRNKGKIIQLSGGGVAGPLPRISGYAISKIGVVRFMENLSEEVKKYNIHINTVAPGAINTGMIKEILKEGPKNVGTYYYKKALIQKKEGGTSYKKATDLILFLGSKYSDGIKGKLISALWDDLKIWYKYLKILKNSDLYTLKRINSKDRGFDWGEVKKKNNYDRLFASFDKEAFIKKLKKIKD